MIKKFTIGLGSVKEKTQVIKVPTKGIRDLEGALETKQTINVGHAQVDPATVKESAGSKLTFHSTLFESFQLTVIPTYNYYTSDETTAFSTDVSASLDRLPRYVTLTWKSSPTRTNLQFSTKGTRSALTPRPPRRAIMPMDVVGISAANGYVMPGVVSALLSEPTPTVPSPAINEEAFLLDPDAAGQLAAQHAGVASSPYTVTRRIDVDRIRVNFVDPSIAGALDSNRLEVSNNDIHLTVAGSLAKVIGGLEVISEFNQDVPIKNPPPTFPAPLDIPVLSYIGYIIERHDVLPDGTMQLGRVIRIDNPETTYFVDREVLYGMTYAYKIRSIVQWVHQPNIGFDGLSNIDRVAAVDEAIGTRVASYYFGDWSDWSRTEVVDTVPPEPPDEVYVRPVSNKGLIRVTWKMPNDPQLDIDSLHLLRATVIDGTVSEWEDLGTFTASNGAHDDRDVARYDLARTEYIYAMYSTSYHGNRSVLGEQIVARLSRPDSHREHPLRRSAPIGGDPMAHPTLGETRESTEVTAGYRVVLYCRESESVHPLRDRDYLLDVRSLSTGERVRVDLNVDSTEILSKDA